VYELLIILLGAGVISVIGNALLTSFREARERKRERRGLLRLLLAEFRGINRSVELILHNPEFITYSPDEAFVDEAWKQSRVRLAQLLPYSEDFDLFSAYYEDQGIAKGLS